LAPNQVVFEDSLEIRLLAHFLEEGKPHLRVVQGYVARPQHCPALPLAVAGSEARCQEPKRPAGALKVRDGGPPFPHQVDERGMERVGGAHPIPQRKTFFLCLLLLGRRTCIGPPHLRDDLLVRRRRGCGLCFVRDLRQEPPLND
jgi:hypothetical protein